jgi:hypothetical protein
VKVKERKEGMNWTKQENFKLISSFLHQSQLIEIHRKVKISRRT